MTHLSLQTDRYQIEKSIYKSTDLRKEQKKSFIYILLAALHLFSFACYADVLTVSSVKHYASARNENTKRAEHNVIE